MSAPLVERLTVAKPCPADWNAMQGDDRIRYCGLCNLNVYNLTGLSEPEVETLIKTTEGRLCGRIFKRQDGTVITQDCPVGLARVKRRVAAVWTGLAAGLAMLLGVFGWRAAHASTPEPTPRTAITKKTSDPQEKTKNEQKGKRLPVTKPTPPTEIEMGEICVEPPPPVPIEDKN